MINVLLVDDHDLFRQGVRKLLEEVEDVKVIGEAESGEAALEAVESIKPDIILMDVRMPGMGGMEATTQLLHRYPKLKILALTSCEEEPLPSRILQAGALGYLTKGASKDEMVLAIRMIYSGQRYLSADIAQKLALKKIVNTAETPFDDLSERELQVAIMLTNSMKVPEISEKLHLSSKTINSYRYHLFEKLDVSSDVELTILAARYNLIEALKDV